MRSKAPLALMEQLIMVLVFALAAALCLRGFSMADSMSKLNEKRDSATILAQNAAEVYKSCRGDSEKAADILGGEAGEIWRIYYEKDLDMCENANNAEYTVTAVIAQSQVEGLGKGVVSVFDKSGESLCTIPVSWQEVAGDE